MVLKRNNYMPVERYFTFKSRKNWVLTQKHKPSQKRMERLGSFKYKPRQFNGQPVKDISRPAYQKRKRTGVKRRKTRR